MQATKTTGMILLALALTTTVFAGCLGSDKKDTPEGPGDNVFQGQDEDKGPGQATFDDQSGGLNEPAAHFHHYWGEANQVLIYDGPVPFRNLNNKYLLDFQTLAWAEFNLEDDGDDVCLDTGCGNSNPISGGGKADTVFAGTEKISVIFPETFPPGVGAALFWYKPSGSPKFLPENGIIVNPDRREVEISLNEIGMADPPHQFVSSRWAFRVTASDAFCENFKFGNSLCPPAFIQDPTAVSEGAYEWDGLQMIAHNGGERSLDPPHPDFWQTGDVRSLGSTPGSVPDPACQSPLLREKIPALNDISMPANNIVPLGTEKVTVDVTWSNSAPIPPGHEFKLKLYYHGADTLEYGEASVAQDSTGASVSDAKYEIIDGDGTKVDPPYESNSLWRFKLVPALIGPNGESENTGCFQGDFTLSFTAHKKPGYVLT